MTLRRLISGGLVALCAFPTPLWGDDGALFVYPSNHGFTHETGRHAPYGWAAIYRIHRPAYLLRGRVNGGDALPPGTYRYVFHFALLPGSLGGLFRKADDVVRVEAWDATTQELLASRIFQVDDFRFRDRHGTPKTLTFSAWKRPAHLFEPRVYWPGLSGIFLSQVELRRLEDISPKTLEEKALQFENSMGSLYLDRGFVVVRTLGGQAEDVGDAAIWTGLYAASQAWRYRATRSPEALARMQASLWALHGLCRGGTLVRYIYPDGQAHPDAASKDTYTGFFFAAANCLPLVKDRPLRKDLLNDVAALGDHFLDHDLSFLSAGGPPLDLNPHLSWGLLDEGIQELREDDGARRSFLRTLKAVQLYFLSHGQRPWPELSRAIRSLQRRDWAGLRANGIPVLNGSLRALRQLQRNVHRSARANPVSEDGPYGKFNRLLLQMLQQLAPSLSGKETARLEDVKILSSQSLHALHFLKAAAEILPKPNRFETAYTQNLWRNKALLKTALEWDNMDEDVLAALMGQARAGVMRTASGHLSFLALYDLIQLEKDPTLRFDYQRLFERQYRPLQADYNAFLQAMAGAVGVRPSQTGLGLWSLTLYPVDRLGKGEPYWRAHHKALAARYGGDVLGQARDPLPLNERPRDCFLWQRSARSLRGDNDQWQYPPLDYLFVYWLARAQKQLGEK